MVSSTEVIISLVLIIVINGLVLFSSNLYIWIIIALIFVNLFIFFEEYYFGCIVSLIFLFYVSYFKHLNLEFYIILSGSVTFILSNIYEQIYENIKIKKDKKAITEFNNGNYQLAIKRNIPLKELSLPKGYVVLCRNGCKIVNKKDLDWSCYYLKNTGLHNSKISPLCTFEHCGKLYYVIKEEELDKLKQFIKANPMSIGEYLSLLNS
ncbi:hypothetical protein AGE29_00630 (plasmid) [Clostridium botulinum]|uniref:Uncharacterized protein n=1 Tax=Clostridium botulinum TaxID=1491 RepID=A0A846I500_CLOBO|nr:hypothetical protein [Clostridium botulinum]AXG90352.1 hypothetical protein AGE29_00630 [Clostridium botulinum]MBY6881652.1 hypothetical protein [Clostridium botulinum]NEZ93370.1 hypothetical protein [Clostridium botulinum]NFB01127.1 hypothetical protein [Clostridium botulinum]NFM30430.1 hypothetical protein [Clostridium botulinum]